VTDEQWAAFVVGVEVGGRVEAPELAGRKVESVVGRVVGVGHDVFGEGGDGGPGRWLCRQARQWSAVHVVALVMQHEPRAVDRGADARR